MSTRSLPARSTRGKRMNQLVGDDALVDEEFWKLDMFKEEEEDEEYKSEAEEEDVVDADFDNPEEPESEEEVEVEKEKKEKKRMAYVDPKSKKAPKRRKVQSKTTEAQKTGKEGGSDVEVEVDIDVDVDGVEDVDDGEDSEDKKKGQKKRKRAKPKPLDLTIQSDDATSSAVTPSSPSSSAPSTPATTRKSTRAVALQRAAEREKERVETEKKRAGRTKKRYPVIVRRITQEELLEEAKETEIFNTESLKYIMSMEEEKKKVKEAPTIIGPVVKYYSKDGKTCVCFDELPDVLQQQQQQNTSSLPPPTEQTCPITGLPAKYKDPKTGICYANLEAFKTLRTNQLKKEEEECNSKIAKLTALLQESKRKKALLQDMSKGSIVVT